MTGDNLLAFDIGNTKTAYAVFDNRSEIIYYNSFNTKKSDLSINSEIIKSTYNMLFEKFKLKCIFISSVVPSVDLFLKSQIDSDLPTYFIGKNKMNYGIKLEVDDFKEVGSDRIANAVAAHYLYSGDTIVIDLGTATTFDIINEKGAYIGGLISPGIDLSIHSLNKYAEKLPIIKFKGPPENIIGKNTISAMESGLFYGYKCLINGLIDSIEEFFGKRMKIIATGGYAQLLSSAVQKIDYVDMQLTLKGINKIYQLNIKDL